MPVTRYHGLWIIAYLIVDLRTALDRVACVDHGSHDDTAARALATGAGTSVEEMTRTWEST